MQQRVTAILVAHSGAEYLERTLAAINRQTRAPDSAIAVDLASTDGGREMLAAAGLAHIVPAPARLSFGQAISHALHAAAPAESDDEWLWLLAHDNAPQPHALARLLGAVEIAPSVSVAGPKLMRWDQAEVITEFGESMTRYGASVALVDDELDQAQHDVQNDVLAVAAAGMLVRRSVWETLDGFDPALPSTDAALDFSVRAHLAGHRVVVVPDAKVASAGGPQHFGRRSVTEGRRAKIARAAQLHRRLVYAPKAALPLHWLSLVPLAILRSIVHLIAKRPGSIGGEFSTAVLTAFGGSAILHARRNLRRTRRLGWAAIAPLRLSWRRAREQRARRADADERRGTAVVVRHDSVGFITGGGLWAVVAAAAVALIAFGGLIGATSLTGGGLLPLSADPASLWAQVGYGWRDIGVGFMGAADPFAYVLALIGSAAFWQPSFGVVLVYLLALPLAALGAWFCARRLSVRPWTPALVALLWAVAPPFLDSLTAGHLGASLAHLLLPWLVLLTVNGARSWASAAGAALVFAAVTASAPSLAPALLVLWIALMASQPTGAHRLIGIPLPAAALFAPLIFEQLRRGNPLALLADPGLPVGGGTRSGIQLALGAASGGSDGWTNLLDVLAFPGVAGPFIAAGLLLPLGVLALLALFVRGSRRAIPALCVALLGFATAVVASRIEVSTVGPESIGVWPASGLSLFWIGLLGAAIVALDAIGRVARGSAVLLGVASVLVVIPLISAFPLKTAAVEVGVGRTLPAFVDAEAESLPDVGTLILTPERDDALTATLQRGRGTVLDDQSTLDATSRELSGADARLANLAGNLASRSGYDSAADLNELAIGFVVLEDAKNGQGNAVFMRSQEALDGNDIFVAVGETPNGLLWRYTGDTGAAPRGEGNTGTAYGVAVLIVQGLVVGATALLAIPTRRPRRRRTVRGANSDEPATTFDEEETDD